MVMDMQEYMVLQMRGYIYLKPMLEVALMLIQEILQNFVIVNHYFMNLVEMHVQVLL